MQSASAFDDHTDRAALFSNKRVRARDRARGIRRRDCMSIANRVRLTSALTGLLCASIAVTSVKYVDANTARRVFTSTDEARARGASNDVDDVGAGARDGEGIERVFGRAVSRELRRTWNSGVDYAFGAGVKALSDRKL